MDDLPLDDHAHDHNVERITDDEMAYHAEIVAEVQWATEAQAKIAQTEAAFRSWAEHLHKKYGLDAGEGVAEDGTINRVDPPTPNRAARRAATNGKRSNGNGKPARKRAAR